MALIYAFQDASGHWHGDSDAQPLEGEPEHGTLTYVPVPGTPEATSPFAGQTLLVLVAAVGLDPGPVVYQLNGGGRFQASWYVYTLLATPVGSSPLTPRTPTRESTEAPYLDIALTDNGRRYLMTATRDDDDDLTVNLKACTREGEVQGELTGTFATHDLPGLARLLDTAITTAATPAKPTPPLPNTVPAPRRGAQWTSAEQARLVERYHQEPDLARLGHELGRSALSVQYKLFQLGLAQRPASPAPTTPPPRTAAPTPRSGPTHEELRKSHARSHTPWTEQEEQQLAQRCEQGATAEEMSEEFGRTVGAIESRLRLTGAKGPAADKARAQYF